MFPEETTTYSLECWNSDGVLGKERKATITVEENSDEDEELTVSDDEFRVAHTKPKKQGATQSFTPTPQKEVEIISTTAPTAPTQRYALIASSGSLKKGESVRLSWSAPAPKVDCLIRTTPNGKHEFFPAIGFTVKKPLSTTTYYLWCQGPMGGPAEETDTVKIVVDGLENLNDDITVEFNADPWLITAGKSVALSWKAIHADICSASDGWAGDKSAAGSEQVFPTKATSYVLTCKNSTKSEEKSIYLLMADDPLVQQSK